MSRIDLHAHSTASDGALSPADVVRRAATERIDVLALTDHDTVAGVAEAVEVGASAGVRVVAGIELSTARDGRNVHMLGYFVDTSSASLRSALDALRAEREDRARRIVVRLNDLGYELSFADVEAQATGAVVARPHIARALVARGHVPDVGAAFTPDLIGDGGAAIVERALPDPLDGVAIIVAAGGVAVVAHPGTLHHAGEHVSLPEDLIGELAGAGLGGLEVSHPEHGDAARERWLEVAHRHGLVATGGSDFHGYGARLGTCLTSPDAFERLEALAS